jgi:hypothetical protein
VSIDESDYGFRTLDDGRTLSYELHWTESADGTKSAERPMNGRVDGSPIDDAALAVLLGG